MAIALLTARVLLAVVFFVAGFAKLADPAGSRRALRDFGIPVRFATPLGILLPLAELAVAVALISGDSAWWGALGAFTLLLLFAAGIGLNLVRGRHPDCHCFGQLHSAPAGWPTLVRNLGLSALACVVIVFGRGAPGPGMFGWLAELPVTQRVEAVGGLVVVALLVGAAWVLLQVMAQQGRLLLRIEAIEAQQAANGRAPQAIADGNPTPAVTGLPIGTVAPVFTLPDLTGQTIALDALRSQGKPVVLIFSDPGCGPCNALLPEIGRWQREYASKAVVVLISRGPADPNGAKVSGHVLTHVLLQQDREVAHAYQAHGTPSGVLVSHDGTLGSAVAQGTDAIRALMASVVNLSVPGAPVVAAPANGNRHVAAHPWSPAGLQIGESAPDFRLSDLSGQPVHLSQFRGSPVLVLFWNPACGFCQHMLADLKVWDAHPPPDAPRLLVVSTGSVADNQTMGLRAPVLLDNEGMGTGRLFGATGTPMAVLVDADGKIASQLAAGAPAVLALAGADKAQLPLTPVTHSADLVLS
jgi:peroxiredoxin